VNRGFEFDGTTLVPVRTGMTVDTPNHVYCHRGRLWFSFKGSVQYSSVGSPFVWSVLLGAGEIGAGDDVTGFTSVPGSETAALMIFCSERIMLLYGSSSEDWNLVEFSNTMGGSRYSVQKGSTTPIFMGALGISTARAVQAYGSFKAASESNEIEPLLRGRAKDVVASVLSRRDNRYYLFFNDKTGIAVTLGKEAIECMMPIELPVQVSCAWETSRNGGEIFLGCTDGYVYQLDCGRSFDGTKVSAFCCAAYNHSKGPKTHKSYLRAFLEMKSQSAFSLQVTSTLSYDNPDITMDQPTSVQIAQAGGLYDYDNWDECFFDGQENVSQKISLRGTGENISISTYSEADDELPHELQGCIVHYINRRLGRK